MTGGIADAEEYRFVFLFSVLKSLLAPGIPVNWIVGVLKQVGGFFIYQVVNMAIVWRNINSTLIDYDLVCGASQRLCQELVKIGYGMIGLF